MSVYISQCVYQQDIRLMDLGAMKTFEKSQFVEHQTIKRQDAAKALEVTQTEHTSFLIACRYSN
jgi:hypothetical protein